MANLCRTLVIAHRGASALAPENTLAAFEKGIEVGADAVEIDVHLTRDNRVVVMHDGNLDRTTDGIGPTYQRMLGEIKRLDAGSWFDARFAGERVPTLEETLDLLRNRAVVLIEVKPNGIARAVVDVVRQMKAVEHVVIQSFHPGTVRTVRELDPRIPTSLLTVRPGATRPRRRGRSMVKRAVKVGANALSVRYAGLDSRTVEEIHHRAMALWVWTVDEEQDMRAMIEAGVDGIITNRPDVLRRMLDGEDVSTRRTRGRLRRWRRRR